MKYKNILSAYINKRDNSEGIDIPPFPSIEAMSIKEYKKNN